MQTGGPIQGLWFNFVSTLRKSLCITNPTDHAQVFRVMDWTLVEGAWLRYHFIIFRVSYDGQLPGEVNCDAPSSAVP
ncbi:hypothetical protein SAMN05216337_102431 [Bradyrhizobium brasilense]|uniref:Uncharacterized protein n=1 Tax=Bradyrhizobium brasilense TaxID=1419277 RepID=A0A1G7C3Z8_9BRAD|nr:hypothetical protein SAMN05216337_102431 [Bradyrhizobium brasilense]